MVGTAREGGTQLAEVNANFRDAKTSLSLCQRKTQGSSHGREKACIPKYSRTLRKGVKRANTRRSPERKTPAFVRPSTRQSLLSCGFVAKPVQIRDSVWPPRCGKESVKSTLVGCVEATNTGNRKPEVATPAAGDPYFCPQPRRGRKRTVGIRHSLEHFCGRSLGCRAPLSAAVSACFTGDSQRSAGFRELLPQGLPHLARPHGTGNSCGWLPSSRAQVLPSTGDRSIRTANRTTESCFSSVKSFSYPKTWS